jgi:putative polyhydroxyalkanoate system protein
MPNPLVIDLPHSLGAQEARRRIEGGVGRLASHIPGGAAEVEHRWAGDRLHLSVRAMGQAVTAMIDVGERIVRVEVLLPGMLSMLSGQIEAVLRSKGERLLDKRPD